MNKTKYKRYLDYVISLALGIMLFPIILMISLLVMATMGRPILYSQNRPGLRGKPFKIYKIRTMINKRSENGILLPEEKRITRLGQILRKTSLDELPELYNVLRGDMSLVGPRPLLMEYLPLYSTEQMRRHEVKPGITGWAQINGRNNLSWNLRFDFDLWYVKNWSLKLDLQILIMTAKKVIACKDVKIEGYFTGNNVETKLRKLID